MENASFVGEGRTGATSDSPTRNGIRRSATPRRRTAPPLRTTGCLNEPESTRVRKPIDLCGSSGRITSTLGRSEFSGGTVAYKPGVDRFDQHRDVSRYQTEFKESPSRRSAGCVWFQVPRTRIERISAQTVSQQAPAEGSDHRAALFAGFLGWTLGAFGFFLVVL